MSSKSKRWLTGGMAGLIAILLLQRGCGIRSVRVHPPVSGAATLPAGIVTPEFASGDGFGVLLASDGSLWSWGANPGLGYDDIDRTPRLRRVDEGNHWRDIAAAHRHGLAVKEDGTLWSWGENAYGQLGDHRNWEEPAEPTQYVKGNDWKQVAAGLGSSYAIRRDGSLWSWGFGDFGQLGNGKIAGGSSPAKVGDAKWRVVRAGYLNAAGIQEDGTLWAWGCSPSLGDHGYKSDQNLTAPVSISPDKDWSDVAVGAGVVFGLKQDGTLWAWGYMSALYTESPAAAAKGVLARVGKESGWKKISCNFSVLCAERDDGTYWTAATREHGKRKPYKSARWTQVDLGFKPLLFAGGVDYSIAMAADGGVWTWGRELGLQTPITGENAMPDPVWDLPWRLSTTEN